VTLSGAVVFVFVFFALMLKKQNESKSVTRNRGAQHAKKGIKGRNAEKSRRDNFIIVYQGSGTLSKKKKGGEKNLM
jgi:hypothetical protein